MGRALNHPARQIGAQRIDPGQPGGAFKVDHVGDGGGGRERAGDAKEPGKGCLDPERYVSYRYERREGIDEHR